jgi:uncharacterized protein DUF5666
MKRRLTGILGIALVAAASAAQAADQKIAGDVVGLEESRLDIKAADGRTLAVKLADNVRFSGRGPADVSQITQGAFVGTTAVTQPDGTLLAREVHIFPESMRGTSEGHRPMDNEPGSTMTNATVARVGADSSRSTMTNATVAQVSVAAGNKTMTLAYKGGEKTVIVPDNIPVVTAEPADRTALVPGAHVIVYAAPQPDGTLIAQRVTVGKNGVVPPL